MGFGMLPWLIAGSLLLNVAIGIGAYGKGVKDTRQDQALANEKAKVARLERTIAIKDAAVSRAAAATAAERARADNLGADIDDYITELAAVRAGVTEQCKDEVEKVCGWSPSDSQRRARRLSNQRPAVPQR